MDRDDEVIHDDHKTAFIFGEDENAERASRPIKRRKVLSCKSSAKAKKHHAGLSAEFVPLFSGVENPELVALRQRQYTTSWAAIEARIQTVLKDLNRNTLLAVAAFARDGPAEKPEKIPAALIVTGPNVASQDLLFSQLAEGLGGEVDGRFVRLRSAEAPNLKVTLKKIIRDVTKPVAGEGEEAEVALGNDGRKYLDYDLEGLHAYMTASRSKQIVVAFQDSEAFDTGLLSDLIALFNSWKDRIQFTLVFGIATSVELFESRLLKSAGQCLHGAQFDVIQMSSMLESVFKCAVAHEDCSLKLGPVFLSGLVERQQNEVAGIQAFISSLKYAYMCHFYANPLSILLSVASSPQKAHSEALRNLPSFRAHVEDAVEAGDLKHARDLLEDDDYLAEQRSKVLKSTLAWEDGLLRSLAFVEASGIAQDDYIVRYINALAGGIDLRSEDSGFLSLVKRMSAAEISSLLQRLSNVIQMGNPELGLKGWASEDPRAAQRLSDMADQIESLQARAQLTGKPLRSQYGAQSRVLRTTVIAQKVQLSQDSSNLTPEDKAFTELVDKLAEFLATTISCQAADTLLFHELWMYESKLPHKDVFIPRPGAIFERALSRPHDYLGCECCSKIVDGGNGATLPIASILYHLYQESGALVNVSDLWTAFYGLVGRHDGDEENAAEVEKKPRLPKSGHNERTALLLFYQGLADLKAMGFVKPTRRRADHVAKNKWLL